MAHMSELKDKSKNRFLIFAALVMLPIGVILAISLGKDISNLVNPCFRWGATMNSVVSQASGSCSSASADTETIPQMLSSLILIQGGILVGAITGLFGVAKTSPTILIVSSTILILESVPLIFGGSFLFTVLPACFFMWYALSRAKTSGKTNNPLRANIKR